METRRGRLCGRNSDASLLLLEVELMETCQQKSGEHKHSALIASIIGSGINGNW